MILELGNDDVGQFAVHTSTGTEYVIDLDRRTLKRKIAAIPPVLDFLDVGFARLRRDGDELELLMLERLETGYPARLWVQVRTDHIVTLRRTSPVTRIVPLDVVE